MRVSTNPDQEYAPKSDTEMAICTYLIKQTGQDVVKLWSRESYPFEDMEENKIDPGYDFIAYTSEKNDKGLYSKGVEYGLYIRGDSYEIVELGYWNI